MITSSQRCINWIVWTFSQELESITLLRQNTSSKGLKKNYSFKRCESRHPTLGKAKTVAADSMKLVKQFPSKIDDHVLIDEWNALKNVMEALRSVEAELTSFNEAFFVKNALSEAKLSPP